MMKAAKPLQSRSHENDKNIWDAAKHLRDGALGTVSLYIYIYIYIDYYNGTNYSTSGEIACSDWLRCTSHASP